MNTQSLVYCKSKKLNGLNDFAPFFLIVVFCSNSHRGRLLDRGRLLERAVYYNFNSVEGAFIR